MEYNTLSYERDGHVTVLTYDRPEQRNAVSREMNAELHDAWQRFRDDDDAFVLVITGARRRLLRRLGPRRTPPSWPSSATGSEFKTHVYNSPGECGYTRRVDVFKPVIAAVNGWAVAAGLENALLADIRIVAENAVFGALERRWNIVAGDGMTVRLPLAVGYGRAMEMIITGPPGGRRGGAADRARQRGRAGGQGARARARAGARDRGAAPGRDPLRQGDDGPQRRPHLRGAAAPGDRSRPSSMFMRRDSHAIGAGAFKEGETPEWPNHGL